MHESTELPGHICTIISATFVGSPPQKSLQPKGFNSTRRRLFTLLLPPSPNINTSDIYPFIHNLAAILTGSCKISISDSDQTKALLSLSISISPDITAAKTRGCPAETVASLVACAQPHVAADSTRLALIRLPVNQIAGSASLTRARHF